MREYFRKPYMTQGITKHEDYMKAIPQRAIDVQGLIAPNIEFKKPYDYHPNSPQMIHYYANNLNYLGGDPVPPLNDPSLLPHAPVIEAVVEEPVVEYDKYTVVLLHFDGTDTSTTFLDEKGKAWTASGDAQTDTSFQKFGPGSCLFDGTGDYVSTPTHADFDFGAGDFTIEAWIYPTSLAAANVYAFGTRLTKVGVGDNGILVYLKHTAFGNYIYIQWGLSIGGNSSIITTTNATLNVWQHIAVVRYGNTMSAYKNGVSIGTKDVTGQTMAAGNGCVVGYDAWSTPFYFTGNVDEFRVSKGIARWTSNFTPPIKAW